VERYQELCSRFTWLLALAFAAFEFYTVGFEILPPLAQRATMLAFAAVLVFLLYPTAQWTTRHDLASPIKIAALTWDFALIVVALGCCGYLIFNEAGLADRNGAETQTDLIVAFIGPIVVLDMVRRVAGLPLFYICVTIVIYAYWGDIVMVGAGALLALFVARHFGGTRAASALIVAMLVALLFGSVRDLLDPSSFPYQGNDHDRLAAYLWLTTDGTFGSITGIMTEFIFVFILLSGVLEATGAGKILMDLAFALTGRYRGGPAQSAVVASSLFGMVSGSTMANVVSTGTFTIPLMIKTGFSRRMAGAVEAVASCGGQIMPPIMGAGVFIMSEIIGVPYLDLMIYGLLPALLYFFSLSCSIYFEASRINLRGMDAADIPSAKEQIEKGGYLLIPVLILLASIISGETPGRAGFKAVVSLLVMVDLVRSLRWIRSRWGTPGVTIAGTIVLLALALAYAPVELGTAINATLTLPYVGDISLVRLPLFCLGLACALVPTLRGFPIALPLALSVATWKFPSELLWIGLVPYIGLVLPTALIALVIYLIVLPVFKDGPVPTAQESAADYGHAVLTGFEKGAKNSLSLVAATSAIGMIVGLLVLAALGVRISILVTEVATVSLFLALLLVMFASLVMGMGLPTVAAYLLLVIVVAPALNELGTSLVAAHMFIFYFGVISSITPPVALAAYGASGISGANAMETGFTACRLAATAFIAPFLFTYYPELLLMEGSPLEIAYRLTACLVGIYFIAMAAMGYGFAMLNWPSRALLVAAAIMLFLQPAWLNAAGLALGVAHLLWQRTTNATNESVTS
jgi:TRAP transporter 4TM/12TM fusion protein